MVRIDLRGDRSLGGVARARLAAADLADGVAGRHVKLQLEDPGPLDVVNRRHVQGEPLGLKPGLDQRVGRDRGWSGSIASSSS